MTKAVPPSRTDPDVENVTKTVTTVNWLVEEEEEEEEE
jgi:hypothetical protein